MLTERVAEIGGPLAETSERSGPYSFNQSSCACSEGFVTTARRTATRKPFHITPHEVTDRLENRPLGDNQAPKEPSGFVDSPRFSERPSRSALRSPLRSPRPFEANASADTTAATIDAIPKQKTEPQVTGSEATDISSASEIRISLASPPRRLTSASSTVKLRPSRQGESALNRWEFVFQGAIEKQEVDQSLVKLNPAWAEYVDGTDQGSTLLDRMFLSPLIMSSLALAGSSKLLRKSTVDQSDSMKVAFNELKDPMKTAKAFAREHLKPRVLHPNSRKRAIWDAGGLSLVLHDLVMIPMTLFSLKTPHGGELEGVEDGNLWEFDIISTTFWTTDMLISFFTGYHSAEGFVEMRPPKVVRNYVRSWFPLDAVIVTVDWASLIFLSSSVSGYMRLGKTVSRLSRFIRVLRLLRFMKLNQSFNQILERVNSEYVLQIISLMKLVVFIIVINHYIACCWYGLSTFGSMRSWAIAHLWESEDQSKKTWEYAYVTALHWSLTQFTPASMEVFPQNTQERAFNVVVIIMAMVTFSSFVSSITAAMTHIRNINARKVEQETAMRKYFQDNKISRILVSRVWHFLRRNRGGRNVTRENDIVALQALPERVRQELRRERLSPVLALHPLLATWSQVDTTIINELCDRALEEKTLKSHEELYGQDREVRSMLFVVDGSLEYHCSEETALPLRVDRGEWACELALWGDRATLSGPFVAGCSGSELVFLVAHLLREIVSERPSSSSCIIASYGEAFVARFNEKCADSDFTNLLFNDPEDAQELVTTALTMANGQDADRIGSEPSSAAEASRGSLRGSKLSRMIGSVRASTRNGRSNDVESEVEPRADQPRERPGSERV